MAAPKKRPLKKSASRADDDDVWPAEVRVPARITRRPSALPTPVCHGRCSLLSTTTTLCQAPGTLPSSERSDWKLTRGPDFKLQ